MMSTRALSRRAKLTVTSAAAPQPPTLSTTDLELRAKAKELQDLIQRIKGMNKEVRKSIEAIEVGESGAMQAAWCLAW